MEILLLCDYRVDIASTVAQHIDSLVNYSRHHVRRLSILGEIPESLDLNRFDVVVIHYSLVASHDAYLSPTARRHLKASKAVKALFIQDEYRHIDRSIAAFREIGVDVLFTCVPSSEIEKVYPSDRLARVRRVNVLTGYVDKALLERSVPQFAERTVDIGYRARKLPAWLGDLGVEKSRIGERVANDAARYGLTCDIAFREEDRLYGDAWIEFVGNCKSMLGVESGSSVFDFTGAIESTVEADLRDNPDISYEELRRRHFADKQGLITLNQISPRCFEAAALRTLMVLYEGDYSGVLKPWQHYVPLKKDHSNMREVVAVLRDRDRAEAIIGRAYSEVACNPEYGFEALAKIFDRSIDQQDLRLEPALGYTDADFERAAKLDLRARRRRLQRAMIDRGYRLLFGVLLKPLPDRRRELVHAFLSRGFYRLERWLRPENQTLKLPALSEDSVDATVSRSHDRRRPAAIHQSGGGEPRIPGAK